MYTTEQIFLKTVVRREAFDNFNNIKLNRVAFLSTVLAGESFKKQCTER